MNVENWKLPLHAGSSSLLSPQSSFPSQTLFIAIEFVNTWPDISFSLLQGNSSGRRSETAEIDMIKENSKCILPYDELLMLFL